MTIGGGRKLRNPPGLSSVPPLAIDRAKHADPSKGRDVSPARVIDAVAKRESKSKRASMHRVPGKSTRTAAPIPTWGYSPVNSPVTPERQILNAHDGGSDSDCSMASNSSTKVKRKARKKVAAPSSNSSKGSAVIHPAKKRAAPSSSPTSVGLAANRKSRSTSRSGSAKKTSTSRTLSGNNRSSPSPQAMRRPAASPEFRRTITLPHRLDYQHTATPRKRSTSTKNQPAAVQPPALQQFTRLDEGLPLGIPAGLLPPSDMPPMDVLHDTDKRMLLLVSLSEELQGSLPDHLKTFDSLADDKDVSSSRRKRESNGDDDDDEEYPHSKPVTSRFIRRVLILFYASRIEAEQDRVRIEAAGEFPNPWPPSIQCMHASYKIIDALVKIGHRRVLKVLFGILFWNIVDVLEWPPNPCGGKVRFPHRTFLKDLPLPDDTLVQSSQIEDIIKLHRVTYVQNTCLVRACDNITYQALYHYIEAEKLRLLRNVVDVHGFDKDPSFLKRWVSEWQQDTCSQRRIKLLGNLMTVSTAAWEHDQVVVFTRKMNTLGVIGILASALSVVELSPHAAEVLSLLVSDTATLTELRTIFLSAYTGATSPRPTSPNPLSSPSTALLSRSPGEGSLDLEVRVTTWKCYILATFAPGPTRAAREIIHSMLSTTDDLWDIMTYLQAIEELIKNDKLLQIGNPTTVDSEEDFMEGLKSFCEGLNIIITPLAKAFKEDYGSRVAVLLIEGLHKWLLQPYCPAVALTSVAILRTFTLLLKIPCAAAVTSIRKLELFVSLEEVTPSHDCMLLSSLLSFARIVFWRPEVLPQDELAEIPDMGTYIASQDDDPRCLLFTPAKAYLTKIMPSLLPFLTNGETSLSAGKHDRPDIRSCFILRTHYE